MRILDSVVPLPKRGPLLAHISMSARGEKHGCEKRCSERQSRCSRPSWLWPSSHTSRDLRPPPDFSGPRIPCLNPGCPVWQWTVSTCFVLLQPGATTCDHYTRTFHLLQATGVELGRKGADMADPGSSVMKEPGAGHAPAGVHPPPASTASSSDPQVQEDPPQWERVLWRRQPFPDNYVPPSFLAELTARREYSSCGARCPTPELRRAGRLAVQRTDNSTATTAEAPQPHRGCPPGITAHGGDRALPRGVLRHAGRHVVADRCGVDLRHDRADSLRSVADRVGDEREGCAPVWS